ncbi:hypothetical protein [Nocardia concava]|uniref:hypothetical protein n=1 Tax=Nocardia concava TaxID=257281 RepID=UPI0012FC83F2|nr:hypothetical protein [Nocardia concava]
MTDKIVRQEEHAPTPQWLLVETFGELDGNYTIVDWGGQPAKPPADPVGARIAGT